MEVHALVWVWLTPFSVTVLVCGTVLLIRKMRQDHEREMTRLRQIWRDEEGAP